MCVITYLAINLTNKKFQVGSTNNFDRRCKEHHTGKGDLEFQRSLRKNPENFYWVVSEDDGLDNRSEEQYYLDFYCGTAYCYNHNPSAGCPPVNIKRGNEHHLYGTKATAETRQKQSEANRGENNPFYGKQHTEKSKLQISIKNTGKIKGPPSEETRVKISEALVGNPKMGHRRKECEVTFPDGTIKVYNSVTEASLEIGIPKPTLTRWARNESGKRGYTVRYLRS